MEKVDLSIVIVSFNTKDLLRNCLRSINRSRLGDGFGSFEVIVIDNASNDFSAEMVKKDFPKVSLISSNINLGFAKANNKGVKKAKGRYVLFLNPDTLVFEKTFLEMIKFMDQNNQAGAATCRVELPDGTLDEASHRGFPTPWNSFTHFSGLDKLFPQSKVFSGYYLGSLSLDKTHEIDSLVGAFMLVRREAGKEVSWWDEDYFWYGEDIDFCFKLKKKGWKIYFVPKTKIIHYKGASSGIKKKSRKLSSASKETKLKASLASTEAMKIFYRKHYSETYPSFLTKLVFLGIDLLKNFRILKARLK